MLSAWPNRYYGNVYGEKRRGNFATRYWKWIAGVVVVILFAGLIPIIVVFTRAHATQNSNGLPTTSPPGTPGTPTTAGTTGTGSSVTPTGPGTTNTATSVPTKAVGSKGCGSALPRFYRKENTIEDGIEMDGTNRTFLVYIPSEYDVNTPSPIVLSYHGRGESSYYQEELSELSVEGKKNNPGNWVAVYPQGENNAWQGAPYAVPDVDDVAFTTAIMDYLEDSLCLDTTRVYATGKSNGGGFTALLACNATFSARLAAIAPVSAAFYEDVFAGCSPDRKLIPIYDIHGTADATILYNGGSSWGEDYDDIETVYEDWAKRQGCSTDTPDGGWGTKNYWECDPAGNNITTITQYKVAGMGHWWPSPSPNPDNPNGGSVDGTALVVGFFQQWTLNGFVG